MRDVRDPAEKGEEGKRTLKADQAEASYEVAPLPDGRWAVRLNSTLEGVGGMSAPWRAHATREDCVAAFVEQARRYFEIQERLKTRKRECRDRMIGLLQNDLFGFSEPKPE